MSTVRSRICRTARALILALCAYFSSCLFLSVCPANAQDSTVFVDDFESFPVGTLSQGCGGMTAGNWRWDSYHFHACYSAGWGINYAAPMSSSTVGADKALELWGGVPFGGGGHCAVTASGQEFQTLNDYSVTVTVSPQMLINGMENCKSGVVGVVGRAQNNSGHCAGYILALVLSNGEPLCGQGSFLELYLNDRGPYCNGREPMSLLASVPVDIKADLGGNFGQDEKYVINLCMTGSDIYGGVWRLQDWAGGAGDPLAEVSVADETYDAGTFGLYQGSSRTAFDNVIVTVGGGCSEQQSSALAADLDFDPNTLNTKSKGKYVTCYVELPEGYDPRDIDVETAKLNDVVPAELRPTAVGDHDSDGIDDRMIKFLRRDVIALLGGVDGAGSHTADLIGEESADRSEPSTGGTSGGSEFGLARSASCGSGSNNGAVEAEGGSDEGGTSGGAEFALAGSGHGDSVEVWVAGLLVDGTAFAAMDTILVKGPGHGSGGDSGDGTGDGSENGIGTGDYSLTLVVTPSLVKTKAKIGFELLTEGHVSLHVYDAAGRMVSTLANGYEGAGVHNVLWDRTTDSGRQLPTGVYFVKLSQHGKSSVQKLMIVK